MRPAGFAPPTDSAAFIDELERTFRLSTVDFARAYYLFATAKLNETYNSQEIYARYPLLHDEATFHQIRALYDADPGNEQVKRLFTAVLETYIGNQLSALSDAFENLKNTLRIDVADLKLAGPDGTPVDSLLYEDVSEWLKKLDDKDLRQELYDRMACAYTTTLAPKWIESFHQENKLLADLGYPDIIAFYSGTSGHNLMRLGQNARRLVEETDDLYLEPVSEYYAQRTGCDFSRATRADISYVFHGKSPEMAEIDRRFPEEKLVALARETFDGLGLRFSTIAREVDFRSREDYDSQVIQGNDGRTQRIFLDVAKREGKRSRAYVYPAQVATEVYLSVKPEGGLDDYTAFFHESGHALHFAYEDPALSYALAMMGNNTVTETYAYTFQNLFLNRHWLVARAGLAPDEALRVVRRGALNDLYMLRRYASKMQFELKLYAGDAGRGIALDGKDDVYALLLTRGTGFKYDAEGWCRDVDAGFYVADYFTAWTLEAQLREFLSTRFGTDETLGEDWFTNPAAGEFLKTLWRDGNLTPQDLSGRLGYNDPTDVGPLLRLMDRNLMG